MRISLVALVLLAGCPADPNVVSVYIADGGGVGDDAGVGDGADGEPAPEDAGAPPPVEPEPDPDPPAPVPTLEKTCDAQTACPMWVAGFSGELECSPQGTCGIRCDAQVPCRRNTHAAQAECLANPTYKPDPSAASACSSLGGVCVDLYEDNGRGVGHDGDRNWCVAR